MTTRHLAYVFVIALTGCPSPNDGDDASVCSDPRYGDGTCDVHLSCDVPDIDCFQTFDSDAQAATWWTTTGGPLVGQSFPTVPSSDPRFAPVRAALDKGWDAFKAHRPVGELANERPALVIVNKPQLQNAAFVIGDPAHNNQPFVVMVETPALALGVDDTALLGVMMHELQHAVGLHKLGDISDKLRAFYTAPAGMEPLGRDQQDDANVHQVGDAWRDAAAQIGPDIQPELGGFPTGGYFLTMLAAVAKDSVTQLPSQCTTPATDLENIANTLIGARDPLDGSLPQLSASDATVITNAFAAFRDTCLAGQTFGVIDIGAAMANMTPAQFEAQLDAHDIALIKGKPFVDGLVAIVEDRRSAMTDTENAFTSSTGEGFEQLRFFSYEEDADDVSAIVMGAAGLDATSMSKFLLAVLPSSVQSTCTSEVANGLPAYGVDLTDEHHATCWRIGHQTREAAARARKPIASGPVVVRRPGKIPMPPNPADHIAN